MLNNEKEKEDMPKLQISKHKKASDSSTKSKKARLKIEISQIHTIEDDDFIRKPNKQEDQNEKIEAAETINLPSAQIKNSITENGNANKIEPEIINDNEKNTIIYQSIKELNYIKHVGFSDINLSTFAPQQKKPFWPENLWKSGTLIYSYKNPERSLGPPVFKNDRTIRFNSRFESGNLMYAYRLNSDTYHCILEYDHTITGQCQWFYFQMSNIKVNPNSNRKTTFYISGFNKSNGVFSSGSRIFMYSEKLAKNKKISWHRAGTNYSYTTTLKKPSNNAKEKKKNGKNKSKNKRSTLQFQVTFPYDDDVVYFCYALPYTFTDLNNSISRWTFNKPNLITHKTLCKTYGGKNCPLLTITAENSPSERKRVIFITARIHPGESNGSIVLHGLIDFLLSPQPITAYLLDHFTFQIVPMINIDGVIEGYYRVGLEGDDLNRVWSNPDEIRHPVVFHTKRLMEKVNRENGIAAYIDFHGHSRQHGTFAYGCPWDPTENLPSSLIDKEKVLPRMLAFLCDAFSFEKCVFSIPPERKDASRCVIRRELRVVHSFTIESSFGGFCSGPRRNTLYNEENWKEIGARVAEALFHLLATETSPLSKLIEGSNNLHSQQQQFITTKIDDVEEIKKNTNYNINETKKNSNYNVDETKKNSNYNVDETKKNSNYNVDENKKNINYNINEIKKNSNYNINEITKNSNYNVDENKKILNYNVDEIKKNSNSVVDENKNETVVDTSLSKTDVNQSSVVSFSDVNNVSTVQPNLTEKSTSKIKQKTSPISHEHNKQNSNLNQQTQIFNCLVELAQKEIKKQEMLQQRENKNFDENEPIQIIRKDIKNTDFHSSAIKNKSNNTNNGFNINSINNNKVKQRSKSTVRSLTLIPSSFNAVVYHEETVMHTNRSPVKNQKQRQKNAKQKKLNEKPFQSKIESTKNKTKPLKNFVPTNSTSSKVIKSPRLSKSMKGSRINRSNSCK